MAREIQKKRFAAENKAKKSKEKNEFETGVMTNSEMGVKEAQKIRRVVGKSKDILNSAAGKLDCPPALIIASSSFPALSPIWTTRKT